MSGDGNGLPDPAILMKMGEMFAAGYFEEPDASAMRRWSRAVRRRLEHERLPEYDGGALYPCGVRLVAGQNRAVEPSYSFTWTYSDSAACQLLGDAASSDTATRATLLALQREMTALTERAERWDTVHHVGGRGYTHSIPHFGRVLREGLDEYERRVGEGLAAAQSDNETRRTDFYLALQDLLAGIGKWHKRILGALQDYAPANSEQGRNRERLLTALQRVPFAPAASFFEAVVAYNFVYYLDDCDNPGRIDQELGPLYDQDIHAGRTTRDQALAVMRAFTENVCANSGWSAALGGTKEDGAPAYNEVTKLCIEAVHGHHRPNYELRVRRDMPDALWDAAFDALSTGCGQPALYNEEGYLSSLEKMGLGVSPADLLQWNGGGCTETMIHGCSNVGSLDAGIHLPLVLEGTLRQDLPSAASFEDVLEALKRDVAETVKEIVRNVSRDQEAKAEVRPQPMRSLFVDDCIERGLEFNAGGARYNWSVVNVAGLANVTDSLAALREVVFETREKSGPELLAILTRNFEGDESFRRRLARCPRFGNDDAGADELAADLAGFVCAEFFRYTPWRGGKFLPSCIMFETYGPEGKKIGATPDGRLAGQPLADSIGPHQGRDLQGPTAMLRSVTRLPLHLFAGTPVVNIRFSKDLFGRADSRRSIRDVLETYFAMGGLQIQVSVVDQAVLRDAMAHPERHEDLIVRIGGYSTYFNRLSTELKEAVLERSAHAV